jgi:hypothetical protein
MLKCSCSSAYTQILDYLMSGLFEPPKACDMGLTSMTSCAKHDRDLLFAVTAATYENQIPKEVRRSSDCEKILQKRKNKQELCFVLVQLFLNTALLQKTGSYLRSLLLSILWGESNEL